MEGDETLVAIGVRILTVGIHGAWAAEMVWYDEHGREVMDHLSDELPGADNVRADLHAAIMGTKKAAGNDLKIEILSLNESNVLTPTLYMPGWKAKGWRRTKGPIANLDLWKEFDALQQNYDIVWTKRNHQALDEIKTFGQLRDAFSRRAKRKPRRYR